MPYDGAEVKCVVIAIEAGTLGGTTGGTLLPYNGTEVRGVAIVLEEVAVTEGTDEIRQVEGGTCEDWILCIC